MSPTVKRNLSIFGGALISASALAFPQYAVAIVGVGNLLAGFGLVTFHDAGHTSGLGVSTAPKA